MLTLVKYQFLVIDALINYTLDLSINKEDKVLENKV